MPADAPRRAEREKLIPERQAQPEPPRAARMVGWSMLGVASLFFVLQFIHLRADFPNFSPWDDWSKYTDEGWYGDGAIRQILFGHWYWKGDFNPAVALPVWPALEYMVFRVTGVSLAAARALTVCVFGLTLATAWRLLRRYPANPSRPLAAPLAMLMLCTSPFLYAFGRMAILEPLLICLGLLALLVASRLGSGMASGAKARVVRAPYTAGSETLPFRSSVSARDFPQRVKPGPSVPSSPPAFFRKLSVGGPALKGFLPAIALGMLLPVIVLTKTTGVCLFPAIAYIVWTRAGYRLRAALRLSVVPLVVAIAIWLAYYMLFAHRYLEDYRYIFSANGYTGFELAPLASVVVRTFSSGVWIGDVLYPLFFVALAVALFRRPGFFANPLVPSLLLWIAGYFAFLGYHNNLQPRYYMVVAVPITLIVALAIDCLLVPGPRRAALIARTLAVVAVLAIVVPDAVETVNFAFHPTYTFLAAARGVRDTVLADPTHSHLILGISGSDITMMTGLPSIDDDFGTMDLDERVRVYRPGWYAAWNQVDDDKMDALRPLYRLVRVAAFPAMDDPDRNLLILYRLDAATAPPPARHRRPRTPKPLVTRLGQQPTTQQLQH